MDARQLEYFLAIVDHDGFGRAAQALYLAQPSLSQAIANLERELGVQLFHRIGRSAVLSAAGIELIEPARQVLRDLEVARSSVTSVKGLQHGRVELATMPSPGIEPLATLTGRFARRHPGLVVIAAAAFTPDEVVRQVKQGKVELGLVGTPTPLHPPGVAVIPLETQAFVLVGAPGAVFPAGDPVRLDALTGSRFIASPAGSLMRRVVEDAMATTGDVEVVAEVEHRTSILPLVMNGAGLAVLPAGWARLADRAGARVARVEHPARLHIALLTRKGRLTPPALAFVDLARTFEPADYVPAG